MASNTFGRGVLSLAGIDNRIGYAGYIQDRFIASPLSGADGKYHVRFRVFDPEAGTWTRRDPLGYTDNNNLYEYVQNDPVLRIDAQGLASSTMSPSLSILPCRWWELIPTGPSSVPTTPAAPPPPPPLIPGTIWPQPGPPLTPGRGWQRDTRPAQEITMWSRSTTCDYGVPIIWLYTDTFFGIQFVMFCEHYMKWSCPRTWTYPLTPCPATPSCPEPIPPTPTVPTAPIRCGQYY